MVNVDRMVGGLCQLVQDADTAPGLGGSTEYGQTEVFFAYHLRAGEGEQDTSWLDLFESDGVQFAVTLQGIAQYVFMFGESWWIQDDEIVVASHLFEIFESVFRISFVARIAWKVQFHVPVGQRDRFGRAVDRVNDLGSSPHGVEREAASVAEHVQYGASFGIAFQQRPVFALIDKETCLLPLLPVDTEFQAVLKSDVLHFTTVQVAVFAA